MKDLIDYADANNLILATTPDTTFEDKFFKIEIRGLLRKLPDWTDGLNKFR